MLLPLFVNKFNNSIQSNQFYQIYTHLGIIAQKMQFSLYHGMLGGMIAI